MARVEFRVCWERDGWAAPKSKIFGTEAALERHLAKLARSSDRDGRRVSPARWFVEERPVGVWSELEGMRHGLEPARRAREGRELRPIPPRVEVEAYDPLPECRRLVLAALDLEAGLSLSRLRAAVPMRFETIRAAADSLLADGLVVVEDGPRGARLFSLAAASAEGVHE